MRILTLLAAMLLSGCSALAINTDEHGAGVITQHASAGMSSYYYRKTAKDCTVGIVTARDVEGSVTITIDGSECEVTATTGSLVGSDAQKALLEKLGLAPEIINKLLGLAP